MKNRKLPIILVLVVMFELGSSLYGMARTQVRMRSNALQQPNLHQITHNIRQSLISNVTASKGSVFNELHLPSWLTRRKVIAAIGIGLGGYGLYHACKWLMADRVSQSHTT